MMARVGVPLVVFLVILLALVARLTQLDSTAGSSGANYDEGVYASAAQLLLHGVLPYRDYFWAHPPAAVFIFSPAMLLDSSAWGDPAALLTGRHLSVAYSLISVALVFAISHRLAGWWGATAAALVWSLDGRVVALSAQVMLDVPMAMFSFAGILAYLAVHPALAPGVTRRHQMIGLALAGGLSALSALTKVVGATVLFAIAVDLVLRRFSPRAERPMPIAPLLGSVLLGAGAVSAIVLTPFMIAARGELLRQAVFYHLLRPRSEIGLMDRLGHLAERPDELSILVAAGLGLAALTVSVAIWLAVAACRRRPDGQRVAPPLAGWRVVVLWGVFNVLVFISTRSFHPQYQLHLLAPLALLAAGVGLIALWLKSVPSVAEPIRRWELPALILVLVAVGAQQARSSSGNASSYVPDYVAMSRYIQEAVPPTAHVLILDARVTFLAGREPSHGATGYLVDPYGHLTYLGLELAGRGTLELIQAVARSGEHDDSSVVASCQAQADLLARLRGADLAVVRVNERWRLGPAADTLDALAEVKHYGEYLLYKIGGARLAPLRACV